MEFVNEAGEVVDSFDSEWDRREREVFSQGVFWYQGLPEGMGVSCSYHAETGKMMKDLRRREERRKRGVGKVWIVDW